MTTAEVEKTGTPVLSVKTQTGSRLHGTAVLRVPGLSVGQHLTTDGLTIGNVQFPCEPFAPTIRARQCFRSWQWGHISSNCPNPARCNQCNRAPHHGSCAHKATCANCHGAHPAIAVDICPVGIEIRNGARAAYRNRPLSFQDRSAIVTVPAEKDTLITTKKVAEKERVSEKKTDKGKEKEKVSENEIVPGKEKVVEKTQGLAEVNEMGSEPANAKSNEVETTAETAVVVADDEVETECEFEDASEGVNEDNEDDESDTDVEMEDCQPVRKDEIDAQWKEVLNRAKSRSGRQAILQEMKAAMTSDLQRSGRTTKPTAKAKMTAKPNAAPLARQP